MYIWSISATGNSKFRIGTHDTLPPCSIIAIAGTAKQHGIGIAATQ